MSIKIYKNSETNTLFIENVTSGNVSEFRLERQNDLFSIWRYGRNLYELKNVSYTKFLDGNDNLFGTANDLELYLQNIFAINSNSNSEKIIDEIPIGQINGINATFNSLNSFIPNSLEVFLNGLKQKKILDYQTIGNTTIQFLVSPTIGENILINYIKL